MDPFYYLCFVLSVMLSCLLLAGWERADILALLYVMLPCILLIFPYGVLGQVIFYCIGS